MERRTEVMRRHPVGLSCPRRRQIDLREVDLDLGDVVEIVRGPATLTANNRPSHTGHGMGMDISPLVKPISPFIFCSSVFSVFSVWQAGNGDTANVYSGLLAARKVPE